MRRPPNPRRPRTWQLPSPPPASSGSCHVRTETLANTRSLSKLKTEWKQTRKHTHSSTCSDRSCEPARRIVPVLPFLACAVPTCAVQLGMALGRIAGLFFKIFSWVRPRARSLALFIHAGYGQGPDRWHHLLLFPSPLLLHSQPLHNNHSLATFGNTTSVMNHKPNLGNVLSRWTYIGVRWLSACSLQRAC